MRSVLITGGAGFIGAHLARHCLERGDAVSVIVRPQTDCWRLEGVPSVRRHVLCLSDRAALERCLNEVAADEVYHLATQTTWRAAARSTTQAIASVDGDLAVLVNILDAIAHLARPPASFVRAGSLAEYGAGPVPFCEGQREAPLNAYAASLVAGTHYAQMLQPRLPFAVLTARLALTYGPTQPDSFLVPQLFARLRAGRQVELRHPQHRRDLIHVSDVVQCLTLLATHAELRGAIINVASGKAATVARIAQLVREAVGAPPDLVRLARDDPDQSPDTIPDLTASTEKLRSALGWMPKIDLAEGLSRFSLTPCTQ